MSFKESLKRIKAASHESLEAVTQFETQAKKDPRELIPYTRVSDTGPGTSGTKQERLNISNKTSKIIIKDLY
jgi:vacuolar-type H+-ATPase subunit H